MLAKAALCSDPSRLVQANSIHVSKLKACEPTHLVCLVQVAVNATW